MGRLNNHTSGYSYGEMAHLGTKCQKTWRELKDNPKYIIAKTDTTRVYDAT